MEGASHERATVTGRSEGANTPENFQLRWACRCLMESSIGRRQNVFRMQQEPHGSCWSLRRPAGSRTGETPWGAGSTRYGSPSRRGRKRARGPVGAKAPATVREWCAPKGLSGVLGPWPWNQGGRAQVLPSLRSLRPRIPQSSRLMSTVGEGVQRTRKRVSASPSERPPRVETPEVAADPASPQGRRESNPSRGRKTPRTDGAG